MLKVQLWDGQTEINGVPAAEVLANRKDIANNLGDVFLVVNDEYDVVSEIQFGKTIASNYGMQPGMSTIQIAEQYLVEKQKEATAAEEEKLTVEQLQEEVATLSYDVMILQAGGDTVMSMTKGQQSPKFNMIRIWYNKGFWTADMVQNAVDSRWLTQEEVVKIIG